MMVSPWINASDTAFPSSLYAQTAADYATYVLYKLTGEKYPGIQRTVETYSHDSRPNYTDFITQPVTNAMPQLVPVPTRLQYPQRLYLRGNPVNTINSVHLGNEELPETDYVLYNRRFLSLKDGLVWNFGCAQGGITVDYTYGMLPPKAGILACATLANELLILLGEGNEDRCRIPERVRSITRESVTFDMIDPQEFLEDGRTGIWEIDLFIRTANPAKSKKQPRLWSPGDARRYRRN